MSSSSGLERSRREGVVSQTLGVIANLNLPGSTSGPVSTVPYKHSGRPKSRRERLARRGKKNKKVKV